MIANYTNDHPGRAIGIVQRVDSSTSATGFICEGFKIHDAVAREKLLQVNHPFWLRADRYGFYRARDQDQSQGTYKSAHVCFQTALLL